MPSFHKFYSDAMSKNMKGVSPLIAAVLLIAFTMAIAGILATWATTFSRQRLSVATTEGECLGALDVSSVDFKDMHITFKIRNVAQINMTNLRATVEYESSSKNKDYLLKDWGISDPLRPAVTQFADINTTDPAKPESIEIFSETCPRQTQTHKFPQ